MVPTVRTLIAYGFYNGSYGSYGSYTNSVWFPQLSPRDRRVLAKLCGLKHEAFSHRGRIRSSLATPLKVLLVDKILQDFQKR